LFALSAKLVTSIYIEKNCSVVFLEHFEDIFFKVRKIECLMTSRESIITVIFTIALTLMQYSYIYAQLETEWIRFYSGPPSSPDTPEGMVVDKAGNVLVTGSSIESTVSGTDFVTIKYSPNGEVLWRAIYDRSNNADLPYSIAADDHRNIYVTGASVSGSGYDIVTIKYNTLGAIQWTAVYQGQYYDRPTHISVDRMGNVYVAGLTDRTLMLRDYLMIKYNSQGVQQWVVFEPSGSLFDLPVSLQLDMESNAYLCAYVNGAEGWSNILTAKFDPDGSLLWKKIFGGPTSIEYPAEMILDSSQNVYVTGVSEDTSGAADFVTMKYGPNGDLVWYNRFDGGSVGNAVPRSICIDSEGSIFVTGTIDRNFVTVKLDNKGNELTHFSFSNSSQSNDRAINNIIDRHDRLYITGNAMETSSQGWKNITLCYNKNGQLLGKNIIETTSFQSFSKDVYMDTDNQSNVYICANIDSSGLVGSQGDFCTVKYSKLLGINSGNYAFASRYSMSQNYPNPFNPQTTIDYELSFAGNVKIAVYDISGKEIETLVAKLQFPGQFRTIFEGSGVSSGVYFYSLLINGKEIDTKKMLLLK
jgi:hypothetical protein